MIEGSGSGSRAGSRSGSIPLTSGSGSGSWRPKNMWIRWIQIRIRIRNTAFMYEDFRMIWYELGSKLTTPIEHTVRHLAEPSCHTGVRSWAPGPDLYETLAPEKKLIQSLLLTCKVVLRTVLGIRIRSDCHPGLADPASDLFSFNQK